MVAAGPPLETDAVARLDVAASAGPDALAAMPLLAADH